jgi:hypothetical protein
MPDWIRNHYELIGVVLATLTLVLAWFQFRKKDPPTISLERSPLKHSAIISGSHNQVFLGHAAPVLAQTQRPRPEITAPNFVYVPGKRKSVFISPWAREGFCNPLTQHQRENSVDAFVLKFENRKPESDCTIGRGLNVIAKLKFHHKNGVTARDIDYGVWLNSPCNSTDMGIGDTRELMLLCVLESGVVTFEDRRSGNRYFDSEGFSYFEYLNIDDYNRVDVTLVDQNSQATLSVKLKFWREGANFCTSEL